MRAAEVSAGPGRSAAPSRRPGEGRPPQASLPTRLARSIPGGGSGAGVLGAMNGGGCWRRGLSAGPGGLLAPSGRPGLGPSAVPAPAGAVGTGGLLDRPERRDGCRPPAPPRPSALSCWGRPTGLTPALQPSRAGPGNGPAREQPRGWVEKVQLPDEAGASPRCTCAATERRWRSCRKARVSARPALDFGCTFPSLNSRFVYSNVTQILHLCLVLYIYFKKGNI